MNDTICAISTPPRGGGIAVCLVSGPHTNEIADRIWQGKRLADCESHTAHFGEILDTEGKPFDQAVATIFRAPGSFTGEDTVEFSTHGSRYVQSEILQSLIKAGARLAEAGEFTRRAFTAGRIDLAEAEGVADIIASESRAAHRLAFSQMKGSLSNRLSALREQLVELVSLMELELDFSEEDVEFADRSRLISIAEAIKGEISRLQKSFSTGNAIKNGIPVAIVGDTNAGKSSLLNRLLGDERAIVSDIHGTTRDTIEE
ncbi:MAG: 50S ribosome-binding GTPase, partial [Muribaculaceae bacterium]|nr:50S ribosome-binding GTPase [Muribaculaceae bacterium]